MRAGLCKGQAMGDVVAEGIATDGGMRAKQGGRWRETFSPFSPHVLQDKAYNCLSPPGSRSTGSPLRWSMWSILPEHKAVQRRDGDVGEHHGRNNLFRPLPHHRSPQAHFFLLPNSSVPKLLIPTFSILKLTFPLRWKTPAILKKKVTE